MFELAGLSSSNEGPATVRMVSQNAGPPIPLPLHVPPGHIVQQIVDEQGTLRHLILSPQGPVIANGPFPGPLPTPGGPAPMVPNSVAPVVIGTIPQPGAVSPPPSCHHPPLGVIVDPSNLSYMHVEHHGPAEDFPIEYPPIQNRQRWSPKPHRPRVVPHNISYNQEEQQLSESLSGQSANDDDDADKITDMLSSRIQPPSVSDIGPREAQVQWNALDTSEASACGGPFPYIDASEFTYEVVVFERKPDGHPAQNYKCQDQTYQWLCDLKPSTEYFVRLRAHLLDRRLSGDSSAPIGFRTKPCHPDKPQPPRLQKRSKSFFIVYWKKPCENGSRITSYHLERDDGSEDSDFQEVFCGSQEQTKVSRLQPNTLYRVRLAARNQFGQSEYSDVIMIQTNGAPPTPPDPPQMLSASASTLQLAWHKRAGDDSFTLQMEDPGSGHGFLAAVTTPDTVSTVHGLNRNSVYRFRLVAANEDGESSPSEVASYRTTPSKPAAPSRPFLKEKVRPTSLKLAWDAPKDNGGADILGFQFEYCSETTGAGPRSWTMLNSGLDKEFPVTGLHPGCAYKFRVNCSGLGGQSPFSEVLEVRTTPVGPGICGTPELVGRAKPNSLSLKWGAPDTTGGADITEYEMSMQSSDSCSPGGVVFRGQRNDCVVNNLLPGRKYGFKVRAHNRTGPGRWSDELETSTAAGPPEAPQRLRLLSTAASDGLGPNSLHLTWDPPAELNGAAIIEYRLLKAVRRIASLQVPDINVSYVDQETTTSELTPSLTCLANKESEEGEVVDKPPCSAPSSPSKESTLSSSEPEVSEYGDFSQVYAGSAPSHEVKSLTPATHYAFKVCAMNTAGCGPESKMFTCRTPPGPPGAPGKVHGEAVSTTEIQINWEVPSDNGSRMCGYQMDVSPIGSVEDESQNTIQIPPHVFSYTLDCLSPETTYRVRLRGTNEVGSGQWSQWVKLTTFSRPPPPPVLELAAAGHNSLKLKWQDQRVSTTNELFTYSLEMENRSGSFSPVYEGPSRSHKVPRLSECCMYRFRIRCTCTTGGTGVWSEPVAFSTCRTPPQGLKNPPKVTEVSGPASGKAASSCWQVEWQAVKSSGLPKGDKIHYHLQLSTPTEEWKTVYRGSSQSCTLNVQPGVSCRVRVLPVRLSPPSLSSNSDLADTQTSSTADWIETPGPPMVSASFSTPISDTVQRSASEPSGPREELDGQVVSAVSHTFSDRHWAALILAGFSILALVIAFFLERYVAN